MRPLGFFHFIHAALIAAVILSSSLGCAAQGKVIQTPPRSQFPATGNTAPATSNPAPPPSNRPPATGNPASAGTPGPIAGPITGIIQPSLDTVHQTLTAVHLDRWKKGTVRDEASVNIDAILRDLRVNVPPLLQDADAAAGTVSKLLPVSRHLNALYDVLLRVSEASRVSGTDDQAAQLQQALLSLGNARLALDDRMLGSAGALEKQVIDLRATIQQQAAERAAMPTPVAVPCVPPPVKKAAPKRKPAVKPATTTPAKTPGATTPTGSH